MSWQAYTTHRWAEGIIEIVDARIVDEDGTLTAFVRGSDVTQTFALETWSRDQEEALRIARGRQREHVEAMNAQIALLQRQRDAVQRLEFAFERDEPQPD